jgi:protein archease
MSRPGSGFEIVEHTADTAIRGWAPDLRGLFRTMAQGLFKVIGAEAHVSPDRKRSLHLEAENPTELLHDWLETLNALHQVHGELYTEFEVAIENNRLKATIQGGALATATGELGTEVKAVTWHDLNIQQTAQGLESYVLLDI